MNKPELNKLIAECIKEVKVKKIIKTLVLEAIKELKTEIVSCHEMMESLDAEVKKENKDYAVVKDDAGNYNVDGCPTHRITLQHMYEDKFNVTYIKDNSARTKKLNVAFDDVKKFVKEVLSSKKQGYVATAYNKAVKNSEFADGKEPAMHQPKVKTEDMVSKKEDLPDSPMKEIGSIKKQVDHSIKGTKPDYKYPKQKDKKLVVTLPSRKQKSVKKS